MGDMSAEGRGDGISFDHHCSFETHHWGKPAYKLKKTLVKLVVEDIPWSWNYDGLAFSSGAGYDNKPQYVWSNVPWPYTYRCCIH